MNVSLKIFGDAYPQHIVCRVDRPLGKVFSDVLVSDFERRPSNAEKERLAASHITLDSKIYEDNEQVHTRIIYVCIDLQRCIFYALAAAL